QRFHREGVHLGRRLRPRALSDEPPAPLTIENRLRHLASRAVPGTQEEHPQGLSSVLHAPVLAMPRLHVGVHDSSATGLRMTTADAGQAPVNSAEVRTASGTRSRPTQANPSRGK